nr:hypothetical protein [Phytohabitans suffuscus]
MAGGVGHRLLGDPVDDQLGLLVQPGQVAVEVLPHGHAAVLGGLGGQGAQRADQAQLLQHPRAQPPGDTPDLVEAVAGGLLHLVQLVAQRLGCLVGDPLQLQDHGGQRLADLVVQLLGDAAPLPLLRREGAGGTRGALGLEAVEHRVERADQVGDPGVAGHRGARAGLEQVDGRHRAGEPLQRGEADAQQHRVGHQHRGQAGGEDDRLGEQHRRGDRDRPEEQEVYRDGQHGGVEQEDPPEQGHRGAPSSAALPTMPGLPTFLLAQAGNRQTPSLPGIPGGVHRWWHPYHRWGRIGGRHG